METSGTWEIHQRLVNEYADTRHIQREANALVEVGLADSTPSVGKLRTWGSGKQQKGLAWGNMNSTQRECNHVNDTEQDSPKSKKGEAAVLYFSRPRADGGFSSRDVG